MITSKPKHKIRMAIGIGTVIASSVIVCARFSYRAVQRIRLRRPLIAAIKRGDTRSAITLLDAGADPNARDAPFKPLTWKQIWTDLTETREQDSIGNADPALQVAVLKGNFAISQSLLDHGADVNGTSKRLDSGYRVAFTSGYFLMSPCYTPLVTALALHRRDLVRLLLDRGADPNLHRNLEYTALMASLCQNSPPMIPDVVPSRAHTETESVVNDLLAHNADASAVGPNGQTALNFAIITCWNSVLPLLQHGADVNTRDTQNPLGRTVLMEACVYADVPTIQFLVTHGAHVNATDSAKRTALMELCHRYGGDADDGWVEGLKILLASGADPNAQDETGITALMEAAGVGTEHGQKLGGNLAAIKTLLERGANPNLKDVSGRTALDKLPSTTANDEDGNRLRNALIEEIRK